MFNDYELKENGGKSYWDSFSWDVEQVDPATTQEAEEVAMYNATFSSNVVLTFS